MELDELKSAWQAVNLRLEATERFVWRDQTRRAANRLRWEPIFELFVAGLTLLWSGGFLWDNLSRIQRFPVGAVPFGLVHAMSIFTVWVSVRQLVIISDLDYSNPVMETQRKIAAIRSLRLRSTQWMLLLGIPLWVIFPMVLAQALIGFDVVRSMNGPWLLGNVAFGAVASGAIVWVAKRFGEASPFFRWVNDVLAGTEVAKAQALLAELEAFGHE